MRTDAAGALIDRLWPDGDAVTGGQIFAVIDGARDPRIQPMLRASGLEQTCLFPGPLTPALEAAAPRLVHLAPRAGLTRTLLECGWDEHWFVLARAEAGVTLQQLHRHLRKLLRVRDETGRVLLFRFYDPRVLRTYLPTCTRGEAETLFGPIVEFICASDDAAGARTFVRDPAGVRASSWNASRSTSMPMIRAGQRQAFEAAALARFEDEMVSHAVRYFPNHLAILGEPQARCVIQLGIRRAAAHGLSGRSDVCRYINLMWMFGSHFDGDPLLPWARATLADRSLLTPSLRLDTLARRGLAVFEKTAGPEHAFLSRALLRLQQQLSRPLAQWTEGDLRGKLPHLLATLHPARCATLEPDAFEALLAAATDKALRHDLEGVAPALLLALAMFFAGSDFDTDPQHEWAVAALAQPRRGAPTQRLNQLHRAAQSHVGQWLARRP